MNRPPRDCLGRSIPPSDEPAERRRALLSDDQITVIANEVRMKPIEEVGRHVMPLIHHIIAMEARACHTCQHWVAYNRGSPVASRGECLVYARQDTPININSEAPVALLTPFDWSCAGWEQRSPEATTDALEAP